MPQVFKNGTWKYMVNWGLGAVIALVLLQWFVLPEMQASREDRRTEAQSAREDRRKFLDQTVGIMDAQKEWLRSLSETSKQLKTCIEDNHRSTAAKHGECMTEHREWWKAQTALTEKVIELEQQQINMLKSGGGKPPG